MCCPQVINSAKKKRVIYQTKAYCIPSFFNILTLSLAELSDGIDMDGETLTDLRFADDVALLTKTSQQMESQMNTLNNISKTVGLKMHKGKTKFMINYPNQDSLCIEKWRDRKGRTLQVSWPNNVP